jgi:hypothetical protein
MRCGSIRATFRSGILVLAVGPMADGSGDDIAKVDRGIGHVRRDVETVRRC